MVTLIFHMKIHRQKSFSIKKKSVYPDHWKKLSSEIKLRDKNCFRCGKSLHHGFAETHHLFSANTGNHRKTNLVALCRTCHRKQHPHMRKDL